MLYAVVYIDTLKDVHFKNDEYDSIIEDCQIDFQIKGLFRSKENAEKFLSSIELFPSQHKIIEIESDF